MKGLPAAFLVDDHAVSRAGLRALLEQHSVCRILGESGTVREAQTRLRLIRLDLLVTDITIGKENGLDLVRAVRADRPELRVVVLTMHRDWALLEEALAAGVQGFFLKDGRADELLDGLRRVLRGETVFPASAEGLVRRLEASAPQTELLRRLSERELEVLRAIARGLMNKEIAAELGVSIRTIETHRSNIMEKLQVDGPIELGRLLGRLQL